MLVQVLAQVKQAMKSYFQNVALECWEHPDKLGTTTPCLCLTGVEAAPSMQLAIEELFAEGVPSQRTLQLKPSKRVAALSVIKVVLESESDELKQMALQRDGDTAILRFTERGLQAFRAAVIRWQGGGEDFPLSSEGSRKARDLKKSKELGKLDLESGELWFWTQMEP